MEKISGGLDNIDLKCIQLCAGMPGRSSQCLESCKRINS